MFISIIKQYLFNPITVAVMLVLGGAVLVAGVYHVIYKRQPLT